MRGKIYVLVLPRDSEAIRAVYDRFPNQDNLPFLGRFFGMGRILGGAYYDRSPLESKIQNPKKAKKNPPCSCLTRRADLR